MSGRSRAGPLAIEMWFDATHMKLVAAREAGHGVEPRKHVQRLVAAQKYRDVPKTQRPLEETSGVVKLKGLLGRFATDCLEA